MNQYYPLLWWLGTLTFITLAVFLLVYLTTNSSGKSNPHWVGESMGISSVALVITFFIILLGSFTECEEVFTEIRLGYLEAVKNSDGLSGSFIFGTGSLDVNNRYKVYINAGGVIRQRELPTAYTDIIEDAPKGRAYATATVRSLQPKNGFFSHYLSPGCPCTFHEESWKIHVPKGTVTQGFKLE